MDGKNKMNNKCNPKLFLVGFLMNLMRKIPLLLIAVVLALIEIKNQACLYIAFGIFILALVWSLIQQIQIKYMVEHRDSPNFEPFAKAILQK